MANPKKKTHPQSPRQPARLQFPSGIWIHGALRQLRRRSAAPRRLSGVRVLRQGIGRRAEGPQKERRREVTLSVSDDLSHRSGRHGGRSRPSRQH
jgi:hypothetical protein